MLHYSANKTKHAREKLPKKSHMGSSVISQQVRAQETNCNKGFHVRGFIVYDSDLALIKLNSKETELILVFISQASGEPFLFCFDQYNW